MPLLRLPRRTALPLRLLPLPAKLRPLAEPVPTVRPRLAIPGTRLIRGARARAGHG